MTIKNDVYLFKIYRFIVKLSIIIFDIKQLDAIISFWRNGESRLILPNQDKPEPKKEYIITKTRKDENTKTRKIMNNIISCFLNFVFS